MAADSWDPASVTLWSRPGAGVQWGTSEYVHEGAAAPLGGGDALAAAKAARAYVDAVEDAQEAASRAGRPVGARRASISRSSGRRGPRLLTGRRAASDF